MTSFDEIDHRRDTTGKFAAKPASEESGIELEAPQDLGDPGDPYEPGGPGSWDDEPDPDRVANAGPVELDGYVNHPDWRVRTEAGANPNLTDAQARLLADPVSQPRAVRLAVAQSGLPLAAERASRDPSPTVRAMASTSFPLARVDVDRLVADAGVAAVRRRLAWA